jgi:hypothetical protein
MVTECQVSPEGSISIEGETIGADELHRALCVPWYETARLRRRWIVQRANVQYKGGKPVGGTVELQDQQERNEGFEREYIGTFGEGRERSV